MSKVNIYELKTNLSKFIDLLEKGEEDEIIVCRYDKQIAKLTLIKDHTKPIFGCGKSIPGINNFELKKGFEDIPELFGY